MMICRQMVTILSPAMLADASLGSGSNSSVPMSQTMENATEKISGSVLLNGATNPRIDDIVVDPGVARDSRLGLG